MGSLYFFPILFFLLFFLCCSHCLSLAPDLCLVRSASLSLFCFPRCALLFTPVFDLSFSSSTPNVSLSGGASPLSSLHLFLTCHTFPAWPLSVYICVYLSHSPPPLFALFFFHFSFFYLGAHSSPPTLEILTKWFQVSGPCASLNRQHSHVHTVYTHIRTATPTERRM